MRLCDMSSLQSFRVHRVNLAASSCTDKRAGLLRSEWNSPGTGGRAGTMVPLAGVEAAGALLWLFHAAVCAEVLQPFMAGCW